MKISADYIKNSEIEPVTIIKIEQGIVYFIDVLGKILTDKMEYFEVCDGEYLP